MPPQYYGADDYAMEQAAVQRAINESAGEENAYKNRALKAQMDSASAARKNAMEIARLQSETSRYGIDAQREQEIANRLEKAREFDASHGLEIAKAYTTFSSTPDMMFARNDFLNAMGRVGQGGNLPRPYMTQGQPQAKTWQDFSTIAQYNGSLPPGAPAQAGPAGTPASAQATGAAAPPPDPRLKAANAVMQAIPPSQTQGTDDNDYAALEAVRNLYNAGQPGSLEKLGPARRKIAQAGMARMGYDVAAADYDYQLSQPHQRSPLLA